MLEHEGKYYGDFEIATTFGGETASLFEQTVSVEMLKALELCEDVLSDLARLDDGTPSLSALHAARDAIAKAKGGPS